MTSHNAIPADFDFGFWPRLQKPDVVVCAMAFCFAIVVAVALPISSAFAQSDGALMQDALAGDVQAQLTLADKIVAQKSHITDPWQAVLLYAMAEQGGHPNARTRRTRLLNSGVVDIDDVVLQNLDLKTSQSSVALTEIANTYLFESPKNLSRARLLHAYLYARGHTQNAFYLGVSFLIDKANGYSPVNAKTYFKIASDKLIGAATYNLGWMYENGVFGAPDYREALSHYNMAVERNVPVASYRLGNMFAQGHGAIRNISQAIRFYDQARHASVAGRNDSGHVFEQAHIRYLQLEQLINIQSRKWRLSDEGEFFRTAGSSHPMRIPASNVIGTLSAALDFCKQDDLNAALRDDVVAVIEQALSVRFQDELKQRIRKAVKAKMQNLVTYATQTHCTQQNFERDLRNALVVMAYDWGFRQKPSKSETIVQVGDREFVIGQRNYSAAYENEVAGLVTRLSRF